MRRLSRRLDFILHRRQASLITCTSYAANAVLLGNSEDQIERKIREYHAHPCPCSTECRMRIVLSDELAIKHPRTILPVIASEIGLTE